jgi:hypothetical protein
MDTTRAHDTESALSPVEAAAAADSYSAVTPENFPHTCGLEFFDTKNIITIAIKRGEVGCRTFAAMAASTALKAQAVQRLIAMHGPFDEEEDFLNCTDGRLSDAAISAVDFLLGVSSMFHEFARQTDKYGPGI